MRTEIRCEQTVFDPDISLFVLERGDKGQTRYADEIVMAEASPGLMARPILSIDKTQAQVLMDDLWRCGIRPTEGAGSAGSMAATQKHLSDMRTIAFNLMRIEE